MAGAASKKHKGDAGEAKALAHLLAQKYTLLERNFRVREGEIDLIMRAPDARTICFVEVKWRKDEKHAPVESALSATKRRRIVAAAQAYLAARGWLTLPVRFDFAAVAGEALRYYPAAFTV